MLFHLQLTIVKNGLCNFSWLALQFTRTISAGTLELHLAQLGNLYLPAWRQMWVPILGFTVTDHDGPHLHAPGPCIACFYWLWSTSVLHSFKYSGCFICLRLCGACYEKGLNRATDIDIQLWLLQSVVLCLFDLVFIEMNLVNGNCLYHILSI